MGGDYEAVVVCSYGKARPASVISDWEAGRIFLYLFEKGCDVLYISY